MSRELKFRGWSELNKTRAPHMVYMDPATSGQVPTLSDLTTQPGWAVMQFAGLKDAAGADIYEGDILQWSDGYPVNGFNAVVEFHEGGFMSVEKNGSRRAIKNFDSGGATTYTFHVIGDIYQNPELLD